MCRDGHPEIGHSDSGEDERCPLCQERDRADYYRRALEKVAYGGWTYSYECRVCGAEARVGVPIEHSESCPLVALAQGIEARRVETPSAAPCEAREPDPEGDAPRRSSGDATRRGETMTDCPRAGKWFGCKFEARHDSISPDHYKHGDFEGSPSAYVTMIEAIKSRIYVRDVCVRCGKSIERVTQETPTE
jgi:hypothetical protein